MSPYERDELLKLEAQALDAAHRGETVAMVTKLFAALRFTVEALESACRGRSQ